MCGTSADGQPVPQDGLHPGDHTDLVTARLQDRTLFDVAFQVVSRRRHGHRDRSDQAVPVEFGAHRDAAGVGQRPSLRLSDPSGRDRAAEHVGAEAAAFLLGPDRQFDRTQRAHLVIVERPDDLQAAEHAQAAIEASRRRDGVNM